MAGDEPPAALVTALKLVVKVTGANLSSQDVEAFAIGGMRTFAMVQESLRDLGAFTAEVRRHNGAVGEVLNAIKASLGLDSVPDVPVLDAEFIAPEVMA